MSYRKFQTYFFVSVLLASLLLTLAVFRSYLVLLAFGGVFAIVARPLYARLHGFLKSEVAAAFLTIIVVATVILLPFALFLAALSAELGSLYSNVKGYFDYQAASAALERFLPPQFHSQVPAVMEEGSKLIRTLAEAISRDLLAFFSNLFSIVFGFMIVLIFSYYLLKDGHRIKAQLLALSPLGDEQDEQVFSRVAVAVRAVLMGTLIVGLIKGVLAGMAFWAMGVPAPLFWGSMAGVASFLPVVGTSLVTVPAILYLLIIGEVGKAVVLLVVSMGIIGTIDNFLQPKLVESKTNIHPLLVLLSILGGLQFYGFAGFILGPLTLAVSLALIEIYEKNYRPDNGSNADLP